MTPKSTREHASRLASMPAKERKWILRFIEKYGWTHINSEVIAKAKELTQGKKS